MKENFQARLTNLLKIKGINKEDLQKDLNFNLDKEEFSLDQIYELSYSLNIEISQLCSVLSEQNIYNTIDSLYEGIKSNHYDKVKRTILAGRLVNVEDRLFFYNRHLRIVSKNVINQEMTNMLFKLLLDNGDDQLARMLSSKNLFYKFNNIESQTYLNYLLRDTRKITLAPDYYTSIIYQDLPEKDKKTVENLLMNNYLKLVEIYTNAVKGGMLCDKTETMFTIRSNNENKFSLDFYFVDDVYNSFDEELKSKALDILKPIIQNKQ